MTQYISKAASLLAELLKNGSVPASSIDRGSQETKAQFATIIDAGIIRKQRSRSGNRYQLLHPESLLKFTSSEFPNGLLVPSDNETANRTFGVLTRGDSKRVAKLGFDFLMLRGNTALVINKEQHQLDNSDTSFLTLKISATQAIDLEKDNSVIVTIENPTVFAELNKIPNLNWDMAVYTAGKMSTLLLNQLSQWHMTGHQLIHFGDYDYVGLLEYARILDRCPQAELHCPARLSHGFIDRYGKTELLEKQITQHQSLLTKLQTLPDSAQKQRLLDVHQLLQKAAKGLEQEAFLV